MMMVVKFVCLLLSLSICSMVEGGSHNKPSIVENAISLPKLSTLVAVLSSPAGARALSSLEGAGPWTVFAPTNEAFEAFMRDNADFDLSDADAVNRVLLYHVLPGKIYSKDLAMDQSVRTAEGSDLRIQRNGDEVVVNEKAKVIFADIKSKNGVVHIIDMVLIPPTLTNGQLDGRRRAQTGYGYDAYLQASRGGGNYEGNVAPPAPVAPSGGGVPGVRGVPGVGGGYQQYGYRRRAQTGYGYDAYLQASRGGGAYGGSNEGNVAPPAPVAPSGGGVPGVRGVPGVGGGYQQYGYRRRAQTGYGYDAYLQASRGGGNYGRQQQGGRRGGGQLYQRYGY